MKTFATIAVLLFTLSTFAQSESLSRASDASLSAIHTMVDGSTTSLAGASTLTVVSVKTVGDVAIVVLEDVSSAARISVSLGEEALNALILSAAKTVSVIAETAGYALLASGKAIAFIPNEEGLSLLHHSVRH